MKKLLIVGIAALSFASCSSGWSCKARYVKTDTNKNKQTHKIA